MTTYSLSHLSDQVLLRDLATLVAQDRCITAALLAHLAEVDERKLYLPAGYPSMCQYCVTELRMSEDVACKRIRVARAARDFPAILPAIADGRLHLSGVVMLARYLGPQTANELLAAAANKTESQIELLLRERFPKLDVPPLVQALPAPSPEPVSPGRVDLSAARRMDAPAPAKVAPLSAERFALQGTMDKVMHDDLQYAQSLLSHEIPSGDPIQVLGRALKALVRELEKRKFAATSRPRRSKSAPTGSRYIPADVRRAVWERDGRQCTFVGDTGNRCPACERLEFDHVNEVARGGTATIAGIRLRCRAHNQYEAERTFGKGFMDQKRAAARSAATERRAVKAAVAQDSDRDGLLFGLRRLGFRAEDARLAVAHCETIPNATMEDRVRAALSYLTPPQRRSAASSAP